MPAGPPTGSTLRRAALLPARRIQATTVQVLHHCLELAGNETPDVHNVLDRCGVIPTELEQGVYELSARERLPVPENEVGKVHKRSDIDVDLVQSLHAFRALEQHLELFRRDELVIVRVSLLEHLANLVCEALHHDRLVLCLGDSANDLAHHANEHVQNGQRADGHVDEDRSIIGPVNVEHLCDKRGLVGEDAVEQQTVHGLRHRLEAALASLCSCKHLREGNGKNINGDQQQAER
mmetsp:Transcript_46648/g.107779  ORF Transcript_46648/g.107779 Transcript_46648/m.107779 type:complete len:236 (-) Transcript_46648:1034-1741(-)